MKDINLEDLPITRIPVVLAVDTSASMMGESITELNRGIEVFYNAVMAEEESKYSVDLSIISFGNNGVKTVLDFDLILNQDMPTLVADDMTPMGEGIIEALNRLEARKNEYKIKGVDYYQPWLVVMTDGWPTDNIDEAVRKTSELVLDKKLSVFPIAIGDADTDLIGKFSPNRPALRLQGLKFSEFFQWLSKSVISLSNSSTEEEVDLDTDGLSGWATI